MKKPYVKLIVALLTFSVGLGLTLGIRSYSAPKSKYNMVMNVKIYKNSAAIDKKLADTLLALQMELFEKGMKRSGYIEKGCEQQGLDEAECRIYREGYKVAQMARINEQVGVDLGNTNQGCYQDNLSEAACIARKEMAIKDIQENMLGKAALPTAN